MSSSVCFVSNRWGHICQVQSLLLHLQWGQPAPVRVPGQPVALFPSATIWYWEGPAEEGDCQDPLPGGWDSEQCRGGTRGWWRRGNRPLVPGGEACGSETQRLAYFPPLRGSAGCIWERQPEAGPGSPLWWLWDSWCDSGAGGPKWSGPPALPGGARTAGGWKAPHS